MKRWLAIPVRLFLGLPPFFGLTVKSRVLHLLRRAGLYRGPIHYVFMAKPIHFGVSGKGL